MISGERFPGLQHAIQSAVNDGAVLTVGGEPWVHPYLEKGSYFQPTVLGDVNPDAAIAQSERKLFPAMATLAHRLTLLPSVRTHWPDHEVRDGRASDRDRQRHTVRPWRERVWARQG